MAQQAIATIVNPLREGKRLGRVPEPVAMVIFGATGDLTGRKLVPALFSLAVENRLPPNFRIVGLARTKWSDDDFRDEMKKAIAEHGRYDLTEHAKVWESFAQNLYYVPGDFASPGGFKDMDKQIKQQAKDLQIPDNRIYYLAAPPQFFDDIVTNIGEVGMARDTDDGWRRVVIEKPFGHDLQSALELNEILHRE